MVESQSSAALYLWYYSLTNFTFSVYFCITKDMNIKIVNDKIFFKCLLSKYSPQYDSFKWKNLNQKNFLVNKVPKEVCHHSFGQDNIFCSFMLIILLSLTTSPPQYFFVILKIWKEGQRVKVLKLFDLSYGFRATDGKIAIFWHN